MKVTNRSFLNTRKSAKARAAGKVFKLSASNMIRQLPRGSELENIPNEGESGMKPKVPSDRFW